MRSAKVAKFDHIYLNVKFIPFGKVEYMGSFNRTNSRRKLLVYVLNGDLRFLQKYGFTFNGFSWRRKYGDWLIAVYPKKEKRYISNITKWIGRKP